MPANGRVGWVFADVNGLIWVDDEGWSVLSGCQCEAQRHARDGARFSLQPATCFLAQCAKSFLVSACVDTGPVRAKGCCCCGGGRTGLVIGSKGACVCMQ